MTALTAQITLSAPFCHSLKDKRMIVRSIIDKTRHKYNVSIAEVGAQDVHKKIILGVAVVSGDASHARNSINKIISFIENNSEADVTNIEIESC